MMCISCAPHVHSKVNFYFGAVGSRSIWQWGNNDANVESKTTPYSTFRSENNLQEGCFPEIEHNFWIC